MGSMFGRFRIFFLEIGRLAAGSAAGVEGRQRAGPRLEVSGWGLHHQAYEVEGPSRCWCFRQCTLDETKSLDASCIQLHVNSFLFHSDFDHTHISCTSCSADFPFIPLLKNPILKANFIGPLSTKSLPSAQPHTSATYVETEPISEWC